MNFETNKPCGFYCRELIAHENETDSSTVFELELRDGTAYLEALDLKDFKLVVNVAQTGLTLHGIKLRILSNSGYWGSNGNEIVLAPTRTGDVLVKDYNTHPLRVIDVQAQRPTEKMQTLKFQFTDMDGTVLRRDFLYLRFTACWGPNKARTYDRDIFTAH